MAYDSVTGPFGYRRQQPPNSFIFNDDDFLSRPNCQFRLVLSLFDQFCFISTNIVLFDRCLEQVIFQLLHSFHCHIETDRSHLPYYNNEHTIAI